MKVYVADKPVRFDRDYQAGEVIPAEALDPRMIKRLADWGKILCVEAPDGLGDAGGEGAAERRAAPGAGFVCMECGKVCASKIGLVSHLKTHGE